MIKSDEDYTVLVNWAEKYRKNFESEVSLWESKRVVSSGEKKAKGEGGREKILLTNPNLQTKQTNQPPRKGLAENVRGTPVTKIYINHKKS